MSVHFVRQRTRNTHIHTIFISKSHILEDRLLELGEIIIKMRLRIAPSDMFGSITGMSMRTTLNYVKNYQMVEKNTNAVGADDIEGSFR